MATSLMPGASIFVSVGPSLSQEWNSTPLPKDDILFDDHQLSFM